MPVSTRKMLTRRVSNDIDNGCIVVGKPRLDYRNFFIALGISVFWLYAFRPAYQHNPQIVIPKVVELSKPTFGPEYMPDTYISAKPEPVHEIVSTNYTKRVYTNLAAIVFQVSNPMDRQLIEANSNKFVFNLIDMENNHMYMGRQAILHNWLSGLNRVLGGHNILHLYQYYQTSIGIYRQLALETTHWNSNGLAGEVSISIYRNIPWHGLNQTAIYVY